MFLMGQSKKGMSALQIKRTVFHDRASYETVWYMCTRIRAAMQDDEFFQLMGQVEVDETYIGGKKQEIATGKTSKADAAQCTRQPSSRDLAQGQHHLQSNRRYKH